MRLLSATFRPRWLLTLALPALVIPGRAAAVLPLVDLAPQAEVSWTTTDSQANRSVAQGRPVLRVVTGHQAPWPGLTFRPPAGRWDLTEYGCVAVALRNPDPAPLTVYVRVDNPGADGTQHCLTRSVTLAGGATNVIRVELKRTTEDQLGGRLFGMRGYPVKAGGTNALVSSNVTQVLVFLHRPTASHRFDLEALQAEGRYVPPTAWVTDADPYFPLIDALGQYRHKAWPGKTPSVDALTGQREAEAREREQQSGPADWNPYGGWLGGPQREATGFFRVEKLHGQWWLVDPTGRLFFSHGIDCVRMLDTTPIEERESWFEAFPGAQAEFAEFLGSGYALKGHYAGRTVKCFSFAGANLRRKYGPDWRQTVPGVVHSRLRSWGLNTIGNWSDEGVWLRRRTPYVDSVSSRGAPAIEGSEGYWGKFPDVFAPEFSAAVRRSVASKAGRSAGDPWCLGFFSDNELGWGDDRSLALGALTSPPEQPAKRAFLEDLRARYGSVERLNTAWGTTHASWETLRESRVPPDRERAAEDLQTFYRRAAETYFRTIRDALRAGAPRQLYLGCRFAWGNAQAAAAAARYCDVVSYNLYQRSVADFRFPGGADVPLIIGEFHFGALDRGLFHTGLVPVADQTARAAAYREYVLGAVRHPQFVGCHWFQYQDEPTTGRVYDEENYQIGFVDIADTPYAEIITASREVGAQLYAERWGRAQP